MPNNVQCVILCACEDDEVNLTNLNGANLCELVMPMPDVFKSIVASNVPYRNVCKSTGAVLQDVNGVNAKDCERVAVTEQEANALRETYGAVTWHDWCVKNWGTKWGTYDTKAQMLHGDGTPVLLTFCCAWSVPHKNVRLLIEEYLKRVYKLGPCVWTVHEPYNDTVSHLPN